MPRYFFSSSVCVYRDMKPGEPEMTEEEAFPAHPDNEYGWEKLYSERMALAYGRRYGMQVRIARFQNCYGPEGTWTGGREKAPAAMCRKIAEAEDGGTIEVWGDGTAIRSYTYVDDMVDGHLPADAVGPARGRQHRLPAVRVGRRTGADGGPRRRKDDPHPPRGGAGRACSRATSATPASTRSAGRPRWTSRRASGATYPWIEQQVKAARAGAR